MPTHIYTSVAANYLPKARVLAHSIKKFHPEFLFHLVLCDKVPPWFSLAKEPFDSLITLDHLGLENPEQWIFKHTLVELSTGVKGFALEKLLAVPGCTEVIYLDPDIVVLSDLHRLLAEFGTASILLTPHIAEPEISVEAILDNEFSVLQHGIYNLGFLGVKNSPEGRRFAGWWADRLNHFCYDDIPRGIFTDQRWADLVPAYFSDHKILRDPIYNVCTWNLTHRTVTGSLRDGLLVNGQPIAFYHFSGFDSGAQQGMLDKYGKSMPALYELREWYIAECDRMGQTELSTLPWAYGFFDNGERILNIHRKRYRERVDLQSAFPNPYCTSDISRSYLHSFLRNDESRPAIPSAPAPVDPPPTPEYRIFVIAAAGDQTFAQDTLDAVAEHTVVRHKICFVACQCILSASHIPRGIESIPIESDRYDDLFSAVLGRFGDEDALLVRAGAVPPDKWDLRLAWSAVRQPGVATVSPMDERLLDPSGTVRSTTGGLLDRLCYSYREPDDVEIASFSRECVYVRADALRGVAGLEKDLHPGALLDGAASLRYSHSLATHICMAWRRPREANQSATLGSGGGFAVARLHDRIRAHFNADTAAPPAVVKGMTGANLHIMHSWGGGLERWVADYCAADQEHNNFVLKSVGSWGAFGSALNLFRNITDPAPLQVWRLDPVIKATATEHPPYEEILSEIVREYGIRRIIVSSLIGHSVDALRQPLATVFVCHDYYPFCSALNITFGTVCRSCEEPRLTACIQDNPHNRFFPNVPPAEWLHLRGKFYAAVNNNAVTLVAPSASVRDHYAQLAPEIAQAFRVIPHGTTPLAPTRLLSNPVLPTPPTEHSPLRVLILGSLAPHKGGLLLECIVPQLLPFCELMLVGSGNYGEPYAENPNITVIPEYERETLPQLMSDLKPDLGLLLSVVPETFSYTLRELQELTIPVLSTGIGSFLDRIRDGVTGLLCAPEPEAVVQAIKNVAADRPVLQRIRENLKMLAHRSVEDMLHDYDELHPTRYSPREYFDNAKTPQPLPEKNLQLFWRTANNQFAETNSTVVAPLGRERQIARLHLFPPAEAVEQLRLDLSAQPGFFLLHNLSLRDRHDQLLWRWDGDIAPLKSGSKQIVFFNSRQGDSPALLYFPGSDPFLFLPIPAGPLARLTFGSYLEIEFALASAEEHINLLLSSSPTGDFGDRQVQHLESQVRQRDSTVQELESRIAAVETSVSWRLTRPARALAAIGRRIKRAVAQPTRPEPR